VNKPIGAERVDRVLITATVFVPGSEIRELPAVLLQHRGGVTLGDVRYFKFKVETVSEASATIRQSKFENALDGLLSDLRRCGVTPELLEPEGGGVDLSISLRPVSGQAGIVLTSRVLAAWSGLRTQIFMDALST
jgi:hypothetical protein